MPRGTTEKIKRRAEEAARLLRARGCVLTKHVAEAVGLTEGYARYVMRYLASKRRAAQVVLNGVVLWCYSGDSVAKHIGRLRRALHKALCAARVKYVTPGKAVEIIAQDGAASRIFSRYVTLDVRNAMTCRFMSGLLELTYGAPAYHRGFAEKPVYAVDCSRKNLPPLRLEDVGGRRGHKVIHVKVEERLKDALLRLAAAKGVSLSELAEYAVRRLVRRYRALKPYANVKFRLDTQLLRDVKRAAKLLDVSVSELVRLAVERLSAKYKALKLKNCGEECERVEAL